MTRLPVLLTSAFLFGAMALVRSQAPPTQDSAAAEVPIGGIILWWGRAADIPAGFEACDGTTVTTRDAVIRGAKPDLQSKFVRGAQNYRSFSPQAYAGGGSDAIALDKGSLKLVIEPHKLTIAHLPAHTHEGIPTHQIEGAISENIPDDDPITTDPSPSPYLETDTPGTTRSGGVTGGPATPAGLDHKLTVTSAQLDNRPAFVDLVFLIRVK